MMPVTTLKARTAAKSLIRTLEKTVADREADNRRDRKLIQQGELVATYTRHCSERDRQNEHDRKSIKWWKRQVEIYDEWIFRELRRTDMMKPEHKFTTPHEDQVLLEIEQGHLDFAPGVHALMECGLTYFEACEAFEDAVDRGIEANSQFGVGA